MTVWSVYLVRTDKGLLYTGIATDVERRFKEHSDGGAKGAKALKGKGPLTLVFSQQVGDRSAASKVEAKIKKMTKDKKEQLVNGGFQLSHLMG